MNSLLLATRDPMMTRREWVVVIIGFTILIMITLGILALFVIEFLLQS